MNTTLISFFRLKANRNTVSSALCAGTLFRNNNIHRVVFLIALMLIQGASAFAQGNVYPPGGNVGINTVGSIAAPIKALHIHSGAPIFNDPAVMLTTGNLSATYPAGVFALLNGTNNPFYGTFSGTNDVLLQAGGTANDLLLSTSIAGGKIRFYTKSGLVDQERVRISNTGRVGIAIPNDDPKAAFLLQLGYGMGLSKNAIAINNYYDNINALASRNFDKSLSVNINADLYDDSDPNKVLGFEIAVDRNTTDGGKLFWWHKDAGGNLLWDYTGLRILENGNVGVGVFSPSSALDVRARKRANEGTRIAAFRILKNDNTEQFKVSDDGYVLCRELKVATPNGADWSWADYVFKKDYNLMPLPAVEEYIQEKGHLPGIPSAEEVKTEGGIEVGKMQAKLLEKIEELTLHLIEMKKENQAMKVQIQELQNR